MGRKEVIFMEDRCIMCGEYVPEGRQVCKSCEERVIGGEKPVKRSKKERHIRKPHWKP